MLIINLSNFSTLPKFEVEMGWKWAEPLGKEPYAYRWVFEFWFFSIRVHHWICSDDLRYFHDHPFSFFRLILKGGYVDHSPAGHTKFNRFSFGWVSAGYKHNVEVDAGGCWSLLFVFPQSRLWGFWVDSNFLRSDIYFKKYGDNGHQCDP